MHRLIALLPGVFVPVLAVGCASPPRPPDAVSSASPRPASRPKPLESPDGEARHLSEIRALTSEGKNGEAYFSPDGAQVVFQSVRDASPYYQIYVMDADGGRQRMLSTGRGKTTCAFFHPQGGRIIYASSHADPNAFVPGRDPKPADPPRGERYRWDFDPQMDIYETKPDGSGLRALTGAGGYDAEGSYASDGAHIVFTSMRDGDAEIYVMGADGSDPRRLTRAKGYDGGPFFSPAGDWIVFRSFRFGRDDRAEVFVVRPDGRDERQLTDLGVISWAPYFHPDGRRLVFAANLEGHNFELYLMNLDGSGLERVTHNARFDGLPSFSRDGRRLLWTSNRGPGGDPERGTSQVYVANWKD